MFQKIVVTGTVSSTPSFTEVNGNSKLSFYINSRRSYLAADNQLHTQVTKFYVTCFGKRAAYLATLIEMGDKVGTGSAWIVADDTEGNKGNPKLQFNPNTNTHFVVFQIHTYNLVLLAKKEAIDPADAELDDMQEVIILGNMGKEPEMRYLPDGTEVTSISIAANRVTGTGDTKVKETVWFRASAWRKQALNLANMTHKGTRLFLEGTLIIDEKTGGPRIWQNAAGEDRASYELTINGFKLLDKKDEGPQPVYQGSGDYDNGAASTDTGDEMPPF